MADAAHGITVMTKELEVTPPPREPAYVVPESDWTYLRDCVDEIHSPSRFFHGLGWSMVGVAPTTLIAWASSPTRSVVYLVVTGCAVIIGALSLFFDHLRAGDCGADAKRAAKEFDRLGSRYRTNECVAQRQIFSLAEFLQSNTFTLTFDLPDGCKDMQFGEGGTIIEGQNENENTWRVVAGQLEFLTEKREIFSRFRYDPDTQQFANFVDPDTLCDHPQRMSIASPDTALST